MLCDLEYLDESKILLHILICYIKSHQNAQFALENYNFARARVDSVNPYDVFLSPKFF